MGFKEQIAADRSAVFLNTAEFGEPRSINGAAAVATVLEAVDLSVRGSGSDAGRAVEGDGVYSSESVLHARVEDLEAVPVIGQRLSVDGRAANVLHVATEEGMLAIRLHWYES